MWSKVCLETYLSPKVLNRLWKKEGLKGKWSLKKTASLLTVLEVWESDGKPYLKVHPSTHHWDHYQKIYKREESISVTLYPLSYTSCNTYITSTSQGIVKLPYKLPLTMHSTYFITALQLHCVVSSHRSHLLLSLDTFQTVKINEKEEKSFWHLFDNLFCHSPANFYCAILLLSKYTIFFSKCIKSRHQI